MADKRLRQDHVSFPDIRTGNGYDVHSFEPGDHVTLCGVKFPTKQNSMAIQTPMSDFMH